LLGQNLSAIVKAEEAMEVLRSAMAVVGASVRHFVNPLS
jgi:hypothetical protein